MPNPRDNQIADEVGPAWGDFGGATRRDVAPILDYTDNMLDLIDRVLATAVLNPKEQ